MTTAPSQPQPNRVVDGNGSQDRRVIGGRYQVVRQLKSGPNTETFLASDLSAGTGVVIKTAAAALFSASARMRLEHEAHALSQVGDGVFAPLLDFGSEDWNLSFLNDGRFNYYSWVDDSILRERLPFSARWRGVIAADIEREVSITYVGEALIWLDTRQLATLPS